jgi:O-antigen/teichoic acid export membrane protein
MTRWGKSAVRRRTPGFHHMSDDVNVDASAKVGRSRERYRRAALSGASSILARGATVAAGFISVPMALKYLGSERYGMWLTLQSLMTILLLADLGVSDGLVEPLAAASSSEKRETARRIVASAVFSMLAVSAAILVLFTATYRFVNWAAVFNVSSPQAVREAGPGAAAMIVCLSGSLTLGLVTRVNMAFQEGFINNLWQAGGSALAIAALYLVAQANGGLPLLVVALSGVPLLVTLVNGVFLFARRRRWLRPRLASVDMQTARRLFTTARWFFVTWIGSSCVGGAGNIVIAQMLGPTHVAEYGLPARIFAVVSMGVGLIVVPLWPAYAEAIGHSDHEWSVVTARRSIVAAGIVGIFGSIAVVLLGDRILRLWVGPLVTTTFSVWLGLGLWSTLAAVNLALSVFLWGAGAPRFEALMRTLQAVIAVSLMIGLTWFAGVAGVAWALAGSELARLVPSVVFVDRLLRTLQVSAATSTVIASNMASPVPSRT